MDTMKWSLLVAVYLGDDGVTWHWSVNFNGKKWGGQRTTKAAALESARARMDRITYEPKLKGGAL
jgi:hypothetical protein